MTPEKFAELLNNRINHLGNAKLSAEQIGDLNTILALEVEIENTKRTLALLQ